MALPPHPQIGVFPDIADLHCLVSLNQQGFFELEDNNSSFGTYYRLIPLQKYRLEEGQIYAIGKAQIKIMKIEEETMEFMIIEGNDKGKTIKNKEKNFNIGYDNKNHLVMKNNNKWVSKLHCSITQRNGGFLIEDNESTNG